MTVHSLQCAPGQCAPQCAPTVCSYSVLLAVCAGTVHNHEWPSSDLVEAYMLLDAFVTMGQAIAPWLMRAVVPALEECAVR